MLVTAGRVLRFMKQWSEILKNLSLLTQLGLSIVTPILLCLFICLMLVQHTGVGGWVFIPGFIFGIGGAAASAVKYTGLMDNMDKKQEKKSGRKRPKRGETFNEHF